MGCISSSTEISFNCLKPNTTYYWQVGTTDCTLDGGQAGNYRFRMTVYNSVSGPDNLCDIGTDLGILNSGGVITRNNFSNYCATVQAGEPGGKEETVWYRFATGINQGTQIQIDVDAIGGSGEGGGLCLGGEIVAGWVRVYEQTGSVCPTNFGNLTEVGTNNDITGITQDRRYIACTKPNTTYWIQIETGGLATCSRAVFNVTIEDNGAIAPSNDLPCNAIPVSSQPENTYAFSSFSGTNINATNCFEPDPGWTLNSNSSGVWYKLNAPGRNLVIDANSNSSDNIDIKLAVYEGPCGDASIMDPNYISREYTIGSFDEDMFLRCLDPSKDYYLIIDGSLLNNQGNFDVNVYFPYEGGRSTCSSGSDPARFIGVVPDGGSVSYLNTSNFCGLSAAELTTSGGPAAVPAPPFSVDKAVWYRFRPPSSGSVKINANSDPVIGPALGFGSGDDINLEMAIYESSDGSCQPTFWTLVDYTSYSNGTFSYNEELIANCLDPNRDYWLLVDGEFDLTLLGGSYDGYFEIIIADYGRTTTNDLACDAIPFTTDASVLDSWNTCNTSVTVRLDNLNNYCADNINEPTPSAWTPLPATAKPVWFTFVAPPSGKLLIKLITTTSLPWRQDYINGQLAVYDLPDGEDICTYFFTSANEVTSDYDLDVPPLVTGEDMMVECLVPGRTYYLMVDGKETALYPEWARGEFSLEFISDPRDAPAPNNLLCDAKPLGDPTGGAVGTNVNDPLLIYAPPRNPNDPDYCMRAENTFCANTDGNPDMNGFTLWGFDNTVWYTFIAPSTGSVKIEVDGNLGLGDNFAPQVVVYESSDGTCNGILFDLKATPTISSGFSTYASMDVNCLVTGNTYFIAVDGGPLALELFDINGYFELTVTEIMPTEFPPSNDDICNAKVVDPFSGPVAIYGDTNRCASREFHIPDPSTFTRDHTVWYTFTTPSGTGPYAIEIDVTSDLPWPFGDAMDPQIAVYESSDNTCSGNITEFFSEYSPFGLPFFENAKVQCLLPSTTYWIMVDGSALNSQGYFDIEIKEIPAVPIAANNNLCDFENLGILGESAGDFVGGTSIDYYNFCSDTEVGEPIPAAFGIEQTVWFAFTTPVLADPSDGISVDIEALNDPNNIGDWIDLQIAIYQSSDGTCSGIMTEVESSYNPIGFSESINNLCLRPNTTYFIQVDGSIINKQGYFTIQVTNNGSSSRPSNDDFCNAEMLNLGVTYNGNNYCATIENQEPGAGGNVQKSVWYKFIAPPSGRVEIRTIDNDGAFSGIDPEWRLYEFDGLCASGIFSGSFNLLTSAYFPTLGFINPDDVAQYECLIPGQEYYIQVDGTTVGGDEGEFQILVIDLEPDYATGLLTDPEPVNNNCDNAIVLTVQDESCQYSTGIWDLRNYGKATRTFNSPVSCGLNCGDTWYKFTMPASGFVKIEGDDEFGILGINNSNLVIVAYKGNCGSLSLAQCDNGGFNKDPDYSITGTPGETIYLQVYSLNGNSDDGKDFAICISERCAADECYDALPYNILGQGPQCFDVKDATGENIAAGDPGYGVGGVYTSNPTNSVYFAFETDNFCAGYSINLITNDVGDKGFLGGVELTLSIYEVTGAPCSHNPLGQPVLDIQSFDKAIYPSGVNFNIFYNIGSGVNNIKPNTRYIIQIEGNSSTENGTIEVSRVCDGRQWAYTTAPVTQSTGYCLDAQLWRHYYNDNGTPTDPSDDILLFSLKPNGNVFDGIATITLDNQPGFAEIPGVEASWSMRRYWDFEITSGSIDPSRPVDVKFYYTDAEKQEIITLAQNYAITYGLSYENFEWFKTQNGVVFNPNIHVTPPRVLAQYGSGSGPTITGDIVVQQTAVQYTVLCEDHDANPLNEFCNGVQYVIYKNLTGFSGGTGATGAGIGGSPLPVEFLYFRGRHQVDKNVLEWATATEIDNDYFELQHSTNGIDFSSIAIISGNGNSSVINSYEYMHYEFPYVYNYYRLKQVDYDGQFEYSNIIVIDNNRNEITENQLLLLYPNPTSQNHINLDVIISNPGVQRIEVYDMLGKLVYFQLEKLPAGKHTINLNFRHISAGAYFVEMIDVQTQRKAIKKFVRTNY
jgi:large repetitive protein